MSKYTTIKVSKKTLRLLHQIVGELTRERGRRVSLEDAILQLIAVKKKLEGKQKTEKIALDKDREEFLQLLDENFEGAGPEDFREYDYEDISSR